MSFSFIGDVLKVVFCWFQLLTDPLHICTAFIWMQMNKVMPAYCITWVVCHVLRHCSGFILGCFTHEDEGTRVQYLKTSGTTCPMEQHHIPEDLHFLKYCSGNLKYHNYYTRLCHWVILLTFFLSKCSSSHYYMFWSLLTKTVQKCTTVISFTHSLKF